MGKNLEILRVPRRGDLCVVERVGHADSLDWLLRNPVDGGGLLDCGHVKQCRDDVDHMVPLRPDASLVPDARRPRDDHPVGGAAVMRRDRLDPLERGIHGVRPTDRIVVVRFPRAQVVLLSQDLPVVFRDHVEHGHFVVGALDHALAARAVVAADVDDQRVVHLAHLLERLKDPAGVVIGLGKIAGVDLHHVGIELLLLGIERIPRRNPPASVGEPRVRRHDAEFLLSRQGFLAHLVPALVELTLVFRNPFLFRLVRRVCRARCVVEEERLVRGHGLLG